MQAVFDNLRIDCYGSCADCCFLHADFDELRVDCYLLHAGFNDLYADCYQLRADFNGVLFGFDHTTRKQCIKTGMHTNEVEIQGIKTGMQTVET